MSGGPARAGGARTNGAGGGCRPLDYAAAGVDTAAGDRAVELMRDAVRSSHDASVVRGGGGFAGLVDAGALRGMRRPLLAQTTDGVGTKIAIARVLGVHGTVGQDLVAMVVDDLVAVGARPLAMTDYIACGRVVPERIAAIVGGVARACAAVGCPLVGGETAEHPGVMEPDAYDLAGAATGAVEADRLLGPERVRPGDVAVGLASSGLHSNGFSLVRRVVERAGVPLERDVPEFGRALGEELLEPTRLYARACLAMLARSGCGAHGVHAFAHVTGGGLAANLVRVLPAGTGVRIERGAWPVPPVFDWLRRIGGLSWGAMEDALNLGVGMVALAAPAAVDALRDEGARRGIRSWALGTVERGVRPGAGARLVTGTKGIAGGAVLMGGRYRVA